MSPKGLAAAQKLLYGKDVLARENFALENYGRLALKWPWQPVPAADSSVYVQFLQNEQLKSLSLEIAVLSKLLEGGDSGFLLQVAEGRYPNATHHSTCCTRF